MRSMVLHEIFEAQAEIRPRDTAVVFDGRATTYGELDARANQLARYLRKRGVKRGASVAILLPRSIESYAAILGILKAGAAYVPIDPEYPADRIAWIFEDSGAVATVTEADLARIAAESPAALPKDSACASSEDLCYVIYTSGSAGRPKGVMVEHRNAWHLVQAERRIFEVRHEDRVYQGASLCFDLSVEEIWLAFGAGATLVAATPEMARAGPDLSRHLADCGVTVLSCVPTLLSMLNPALADLPALRLLILGGETCSRQLVERWVRPGRRIVNTYGPTETTVIATYADVVPGKPVTIGRPVPGYRIDLRDDQLRPVPQGRTGEICIAGTGVARGYRGLHAETQTRFAPDPCKSGARMYRSGDLGRLDGEGNIEFAGRADGQVKLRGLRVELGEIEAALLRDESVRSAACALCESASGDRQLVAWVVPRTQAGSVNEERIFSQLRTWLPAWMVPSLIETVSDLPRLATGKLDRASLPDPRARSTVHPALPKNSAERRLTEVWSALFGRREISVDDDFFLDLGGHSLLAARMVSELRKFNGDATFATVTMRDIYSHPTISGLAGALKTRITIRAGDNSSRPPREADPVRHFFAGAIQTASLYFVFGFRCVQWITPWLVFFLLLRHHSALESGLSALAIGIVVLPAVILIAICVKWILLGRIRPGRHPLWGAFYLRWWFVQTLVQSVPLNHLGGTPLLPFVYRLFGARIGRDAHIASDLLAAFDLTSIGEGSSVDEGASLLGYAVEAGDLVIGPVSIGRDCLVGTRSVLCPGAAMEDGARLEDLSLLSSGERIPAGQTWSGSPAQRRFQVKKAERPPSKPGRIHQAAITALYAAIALIFPLIELLAFLPGVAILTRFNPGQALFYLAAALAGACFILWVTAEVALLKWLLIGRARSGRYPLHGWFYIRNWVVEQLLAFGVDAAGPLHSTIFLKPWYRALGARLGRFVELSTASTTTPDLLDIEDDCTIADEVSLGSARVERGWLTLAPIRLGRRAFVGNGAVIPAGTTLGAESLVGVLTIAPADREQAARNGACWLGSPPIFLKRRQAAAGFPEQTTFRPARKLQWARGCWEILRISLPGGGLIIATVGLLETALKLWDKLGPAVTLLLLPAIYAAFCAAVMLAVVPFKWIVVGRYRPFERPLWSAFLWRLEFVNALFEFLATPIGLETLRGTPLLPWYLAAARLPDRTRRLHRFDRFP